MRTVRTVPQLRRAVGAARAQGARVGLVPTMGAFHDGHLALMRRARECCSCVVVSLFVNPLQFNDARDLARYPRSERRDRELAREAGVDVLFAPTPEVMYPSGFATAVEVASLAAPLEGEVRGTQHFRGVATVVAKLFNMVAPDVAYFGQKDAQQALLVRRLARDLDFPVRVEICPTVREGDGLALSSRNVLLDAESRRRAPALSRALLAVERSVSAGERDATAALAPARALLAEAGIGTEYLAAVDAESLAPVREITGPTLVAVAARFGGVRLIDNIVVAPVAERREGA